MYENDIVQKFRKICSKKGDFIPLIGNSKYLYGIAIKSSKEATKPIYISIGHKISLNTAREITIKLCDYKIPEPIRNSDIK